MPFRISNKQQTALQIMYLQSSFYFIPPQYFNFGEVLPTSQISNPTSKPLTIFKKNHTLKRLKIKQKTILFPIFHTCLRKRHNYWHERQKRPLSFCNIPFHKYPPPTIFKKSLWYHSWFSYCGNLLVRFVGKTQQADYGKNL